MKPTDNENWPELDGKTDKEIFDILFPEGEVQFKRQIQEDRKALKEIIMEPGPVVDMTREKLSKVAPEIRLDHIDDIQQAGLRYLKRVQEWKNKVVGTGFEFIDKPTRGLAPGQVMCILARTSTGKTAFAQNILRNLSKKGVLSLFISLEQTTEDVYERYAQMVEGMSGQDLEETFQNRKDEAEAIIAHVTSQLPFCYTVDRSGLTISQIRDYVTVMTEFLYPPGCVVIDYLGLIEPESLGGNTYEQTSRMALEIQRMAKDLECGVIYLAQTSRRAGSIYAPITMDMARDSGKIEESVNVLIGCWREKEPSRKLMVEILKNKRGGLGGKACNFNLRTMEITE